jgi:DNA-binding transcriptional ArsR family regulator
MRDATAEEMKALANPLRLRILRLCIDEALTNQQLAARLGRDPGTVLFHVRVLERAGFLKAEDQRRGARGAAERPYRITGKSWQLRMRPNAGHSAAVLEAVRQEVVEGGDDGVLALVRLGVRLNEADRHELRRRIRELGDDFAARDDPAGEPVGLLLALHRRDGKAQR